MSVPTDEAPITLIRPRVLVAGLGDADVMR
jgi:hypothetical protein